MDEALPAPPAFLTSLYGLDSDSSYVDRATRARLQGNKGQKRPHVTLTFAQSLDAKIAGPGGRQVALSGKESMIMTHWMRTMHDGILVGIGTALNDDPQLNTRHLPQLPAATTSKYHAPHPIILDAHLRLSPTCKLLKNYQAKKGLQPIVFCTEQHDKERLTTLLDAGAKVHITKRDESHRIVSIKDVLSILYREGIKSLMVEGGAQVISSFLSLAKEGIVDTLVITVAPTLLGADAVGYGADILGSQVPKMKHVATEVVGRDVVMALKFDTATDFDSVG
ncbi:bacterial bifunctional deaminase-reductase [Heliocybe sulcata]|uniref:2,5-diamino-6-ribosylamino-4(3H)-pyrimidinone 5'-phosphate reductase n=1 Tax=Heliocybe sulcata TaxID=5364 RepID=A0A5C3NK10_9AGAM|nr:bacterial bifunctional deaminase-reductase [Heliocybe sulcata]